MTNPTGTALVAHERVVEIVAKAVWKTRRLTALRDYKIELEKWGDGSIPKANHVFEEARAAIEAYTKAMREGE